MTGPTLVPLAFDSEHFGLRIARAEPGVLRAGEGARLADAARQAGLDCVYLLADGPDAMTLAEGQGAGFALVDVRLELVLRGPAGLPAADARVRPARPGDVPALERIAARAHDNTRFARDPEFAPARVGALYAAWIARACAGAAARVLVADDAAGPAGYVTVDPAGPEGPRIGLLGVDARARGMGLGRALVAEAVRWAGDLPGPPLSVVTQGLSPGAQRLYQSFGFVTSRVGAWLHLWPRGRAARP